MSGHNRGFEDERRLIDEQLRDCAEAAADSRQRRQREEEAERLALAQRQRQQERLERLSLDTAERTPPQFHAFLRELLTGDDGPPPSGEWPPWSHDELQR